MFGTTVVDVFVQSLFGACEDKLYGGFGDYERSITIDVAAAQQLFNQGIRLLYGFNHDEAIRSVQAAVERDPKTAMAWWSIAFAHGMNINDSEMSDERSRLAREASNEALARMDQATPVEMALIRAVSARCKYPAPDDRSGLNRDYTDGMGEAYHGFSNDPDVGTLFADSLMIVLLLLG